MTWRSPPIVELGLVALSAGIASVFGVVLGVLFWLALIATSARGQDHDMHHAQYQNWWSNEGFSCCNNQDCGTLPETRVRENAGHTEVLVSDNRGDQWCPVESRHLVNQQGGKRTSPDWSMDHACIIAFASGGVCARLKCFMEKGKF